MIDPANLPSPPASGVPGDRSRPRPRRAPTDEWSARQLTSDAGNARTDIRRRISYLMLSRVVLITLVLGATVALDMFWPAQLASPASSWLFGIIIATYLLSIAYAFYLPRIKNPLVFTDVQLAGDLAITTVLVHLTGGAQSGYTFFYALSIVGAATVRHRRGAFIVTIASVVLFVAVAMLGWLGWLPVPGYERSDLLTTALVRQLVLNIGACVAIGLLAANLGEQIARSGRRLEEERTIIADLAALKEDIIRSLSSGLLTVDLEGRVTTWNQAATDILGVAAAGAVGMPLEEILPSMGEHLAQAEPDQVLRRGEIGAVRAGGKELRLGITVSPLLNHRGATIGRIVNFQDLTEMRRMEREMKRTERLAVIGGVAAGVAHELRNPLQSISGCVELLRGAQEVNGENRALMDIVVREVDRLNRLLTDLLDYARPRERLPMKIDLGAVLDETTRVFAQDRTHANVKVRCTLPPGAGEVEVDADPAQLRQVVWNLLRNAAEAMPEGGEIGIGLRVEPGWTEVLVTDGGVGISAEDLEHLFEPFFTTKPGGNGLGLPTVHRIVTEHGGTIVIKSQMGKGTEVRLRLPAAAS